MSLFSKKKKIFLNNQKEIEITSVNNLPEKVEKRFVLLAHVDETSINKKCRLCEFVLVNMHDLETGPLFDIMVLTGKNAKKVFKNVNESMFSKDSSGELLTLVLGDLEIGCLEKLYYKNKNIKFYNDTLVQRIEDPVFIECAYNQWLEKEYVDVKYLEALIHNINERKERINRNIVSQKEVWQDVDKQI